MSTSLHHLLLTIVGVLVAHCCLGQRIDSLDQAETPDINEQRLEDLLQDAPEDGEFDLNTAFENLAIYRKNPLNLNEVGEEDLRDLQLLTDIQIANILEYRRIMGGFIALYELQAIDGLDMAAIRRILPFVSLDKGLDDFNIPIRRMLAEGQNEVYIRWSRVLEQQKGFTPLPERPDSTPYLGDANQYYFRYRHTYSNKLSYGFTAEKDRGEEFFRGSNKQGFDYYSAHFFLRDYNSRLKALAIGDYVAGMGQGLILQSGFAYGKSALVTSVRRSGRTLRQYTSANEANFLRGAAATLALGKQWEVTLLASYRLRDGNVLEARDTLEQEFADPALVQFSALSLSGYHRTAAELADRNAIGHWTYGAVGRWQGKRGHVAINGVYHQLDKTLTLTPRIYNLYYFQGNTLLNTSLDYAWRWRNVTFFGETAMSDNGAVAALNGLLLTLHRNVNFAAVHRHYPRDFQTLTGDPFGESTGGRNEYGMYFGLEVFPRRNWIISGYVDTWRHPWLRFDADAPSRGEEYRLRITYFQKRKLETYLEFRDEIKGKSFDLFESNLDAVLPSRRFQARLHFAYQVSKALEWRSRVDWGFASNPINDTQRGLAVYQDLLFYPIGVPWILSTRLALFDTDGYQVRFYNYENGLLYNFRIPAYYNQGSRFYLNVRYKGIRNLTLEARYARLFWANQETVGSGLESTGSPTRTELQAQVKWSF